MLALVDLLIPFRFRFYYNSREILFLWQDRYILQTVAKGDDFRALAMVFSPQDGLQQGIFARPGMSSHSSEMITGPVKIIFTPSGRFIRRL